MDLQAEVQAAALQVPEEVPVHPARHPAPNVVGAQAHDRAVQVNVLGPFVDLSGQLRGVHLASPDEREIYHRPGLYRHVLDRDSAAVELDDSEPRLGRDLAEAEPLGRTRVVGVLLVLVEVVVVAERDVVERALQHPRVQVRLAHLVLPRLQVRHQPVRDQDVDVRVTLRRDGARGGDRPVRHQRHADHNVPDLYGVVVELEPVGRVGVDQVRVL